MSNNSEFALKTIYIFLVLAESVTMTLDVTTVYGIKSMAECDKRKEIIRNEYGAKEAFCYDNLYGDIFTRFRKS